MLERDKLIPASRTQTLKVDPDKTNNYPGNVRVHLLVGSRFARKDQRMLSATASLSIASVMLA